MRASARQDAAPHMARPALRVPTPPLARAPTACFVRVTLANFFFFMNFASFFLLPLHVRALGGSERTIGLVMGTTGMAGLIIIPVLAILLDRLERRAFLLAGIATMGIAALGFLLVERIGPMLFVLRVVQGLAFAASFNAASTLAAEFAPPERRAAMFGIFGVSTLGTHALAPALGEFLIHLGGFHLLFAAAAACSTIAFAVAWGLPRATAAHAAPAVAAVTSAELYFTLVTVGFCGLSFGAVITYVPTFVHDELSGPVSTFFLSYTAAAVLTRLVGGGLSDDLGRRTVIVPALALLGISLLVLATVRSATMLAGAALLFGTAQGFVFPTLNAFTIDQIDPGRIGRVQTLFNGSFNVGVTVGSLGFGVVVEALGYRPMFVCAAAMAGMALAVFVVATGRGAPARSESA
jgi:predicted MFS family arabinose efflux permease